MKEIWKDIKIVKGIDYGGKYQASSLGKIKRLSFSNSSTERILKLHKNKCGYINCYLFNKGLKKTHLVHRIIAKTFIDNFENKEQANHKNGIKDDNKLENLEWNTRSENIRHSFRELGRKPSYSMKGKIGGLNPISKSIKQYDTNGVLIKIWGGLREASRELKISSGGISECCNPKGRLKTSGGFIWKYAQ